MGDFDTVPAKENMELGRYNQNSLLKPFYTERRHSLVLGKPKTGKTTTLVRLALDDIYNGDSVVFLDPRGEAIDEILRHIPKNRQKDVLYFNPSLFPFAFNILSNVPEEQRALLNTTIIDTFKGVWGYDKTPTPILDQYLRAGIGTLLEVPGTTLVSLKFLLTDKVYRTELLGQVKDILLKDFWNDFDAMSDKEKRQDTSSTLNKIRAFIFEPRVRNCIDQAKNRVVFKDKIVLVSLNQGTLGNENASLLGALILAQLYTAGIQGEETSLYIDGAHRFGTSILGNILSACPNVTATLSLQYLDQLSRTFQPTLLGSVGQVLAFRCSVRDAEVLEPEFNLSTGEHLHTTNELRAYVAIDGVTTELHMFEHEYPLTNQTTKIIDRCISQCTSPLTSIEQRLERFF